MPCPKKSWLIHVCRRLAEVESVPLKLVEVLTVTGVEGSEQQWESYRALIQSKHSLEHHQAMHHHLEEVHFKAVGGQFEVVGPGSGCGLSGSTCGLDKEVNLAQ